MLNKAIVSALFVFNLILIARSGSAQNVRDELKPLYEELDSLFADDSVPLNLFELADSILALENAKVSALLFRAGYVSQVVSAGRSFGIDQYGLSPSASYFHYSGFGGGITGYWSSDYSPSYYMTDVNLGYNHTFKDKLTLIATHSFYSYNDTLPEHSFNKSAQASLNYHFKYFDIGTDYGYLYGSESAHRVVAHANGTVKFKFRNSFIDAVTLMPGASLQWGNAGVIYWRQPRTAVSDLYWIIRNNDYPKLDRGEYLKLTYLLETNRQAAATFFLRQRDYTSQQITDLFNEYSEGAYNLDDTFGLMNISISFPVIVRAGKFSLLMNYTYNQPQALPGENFDYEASQFFSSSLSYLITWIKK
jgi:hypothetical protein